MYFTPLLYLYKVLLLKHMNHTHTHALGSRIPDVSSVCSCVAPHVVVNLLCSRRGTVLTEKQEEGHHKCRDQTHTHTQTLGCNSSPMVLLSSSELIKMCKTTPLVFTRSRLSSVSFSLVSSLFSPYDTSRIWSYVTLRRFLLASVACSTYWLGIRSHWERTVQNDGSFVQLMHAWCLLEGCVCVFGGGWLRFNEWLLGRTGGVREEFVNYEWSTSA